MGALRIIFFMVVGYYAFRFIAKYLLPYFRAVSEINDRQKRDQNEYVQYNSNKSQKSSRSTDGDYVDYKEIK